MIRGEFGLGTTARFIYMVAVNMGGCACFDGYKYLVSLAVSTPQAEIETKIRIEQGYTSAVYESRTTSPSYSLTSYRYEGRYHIMIMKS